ncbi:Hypp7703 [Branchiostoma lanceolatum]|uniref:Hypp7703 protein n=1 Tax=Branchiostoma lanceolatum TaxID=7740 RepID=A0A8J9Z382_BRALA|nr:Hypp7703 [Branchiostoma lanceolatum]
MDDLSPATASVALHGDTDERMDLSERPEGGLDKEECTEPFTERAPTNTEDKSPNLSSVETKQAGSGDCTEFVAFVPEDDSQSSAESSVDEAMLDERRANHSVDPGGIAASKPEESNSDTNLEKTPRVSDTEQEPACTEKLVIAEGLAEAKGVEGSNEDKLSDKSAPPRDDLGGACAAPPRTKSTKDDLRTVVDFEDEMELWLWMNNIIDQCGDDVLEEQDYTLTEWVCQTTGDEKDGDQNEDGASMGTLEAGRKRSEDDMLHEKLNIRRQEFDRELLRRVTIRAYGRHLPRGINPSELGHYFFEVLPELFSRIAWFDACYTRVEMNAPGDFNTFSLFIVPGVEFWGHIPLPFPLETRLSLGQQKCRLEELSLWTEFNRKCFARTFFSVADKYKIPKFWKAQVANFDKIVLALRERTAEMKKLKKKDLKKLAPQKTFLQVFEDTYENISNACRKLLCPKCNRQFNEAVAFEVCGHELCTGCVADCLRSGAPCPVCNTTLKGTRFLPVWRFRWFDEGLKLGGQKNQKTPDSHPPSDISTQAIGSGKTEDTEVVDDSQKDSEGRRDDSTEIVDDTRKDSEGRHDDSTEIVDDTRKDSEDQHEHDTQNVDGPPKDSEVEHKDVAENVEDTPKHSKARHEVGTEIVDDNREDSEGRHEDDTEIVKGAEAGHEDGTEIVDDSPEDEHDDGRTVIPAQDTGEVAEDFQSLSVDDDGLEILPTAKCG